MASSDTTIVLTDITAALSTSEKEAEGKPAALIVVGGDLNGTIFDIEGHEVKVGRNPESEITLEFQGVSRHHFSLIVREDGVRLEDKGSRNGTYLNNKKIEKTAELLKGDIIKLGSIALRFIPKGDYIRQEDL